MMMFPSSVIMLWRFTPMGYSGPDHSGVARTVIGPQRGVSLTPRCG